MQAYFLNPGTYNYAGRTESRKLHSEFVNFVMREHFSTVYAMHLDFEQRKASPPSPDTSVEAFIAAHRMTICPIFPRVRALMDAAKSKAAILKAESTDATDADLKHQQSCTCSPCASMKESMASMQERYLIEQGQEPDSQEADLALKKLLGKRRTDESDIYLPPNPATREVTSAVGAFVTITDGSSCLKLHPVSTVRKCRAGLVIPETPVTGDTEIEYGSSPRCASTASYQYSPDDQQTLTDEEWQKDTPVPGTEIASIYAEGMHSDGDQPSDSNKKKRSKIAPTVLDF